MITDWFRTRAALVRGLDELRDRLAEADELLEEAREEAADLTVERGELRRRLAGERIGRRAAESRAVWRAPVGSDRGALLLERDRANALEARLATLQAANMARDVVW